MASGNTYFDDMRSKSEVIDPPQSEDMMEVSEHVNDPAQTTLKPNVTVSSRAAGGIEWLFHRGEQRRVYGLLLYGLRMISVQMVTHCVLDANLGCITDVPLAGMNLAISDVLPWRSKLKHESQCVYRPYNCPYAGSECTVIGDIPYLVAHLKDDHKVDMHNGSTFNHRYVKSNPHEVENATWMLTLPAWNGASLYSILRFMGDDNEAKNYSYSLEVGGTGRKMIWQGVPRSIRDSHRKVRDSFDGLIIQRNMALFFSGGDRKELKLRVTGRIWKEQ
ncbi:E3 ubiquitin-protein ligase DIS1 [Vitis vinifera]|uniref:RING-type E3 ubiquitin transferase n=1 Tax=Vitis vinifera TaxID=29760 RepID=A0A438GDP6_VITVI|nr:E3 ubiquitin-protein ligase DIS1 [Vitis vinifera]